MPDIRHVTIHLPGGRTIQTMRVIRSHDWPSREEWAKERTTWTRYFGDDDPVHVSRKASDYMTPTEIDALLAKLKARRLQLSRDLREAKKQRPHCFQQKGETKTQWNQRWYTLSKQDQEFDAGLFLHEDIRAAVTCLEHDGIPMRDTRGLGIPELQELLKRYQAAYDTEEARIEAKIAATPVDDAAWAEELARRAEVERIDSLPDEEWYAAKFGGAG